jgi:hypothetical protein
MVDKKLETLAYRLKDLSTLRNLFSELNFDFADKPVNKDNWNDEQKKIVQEAKIIASKDDYKIYYIQTNTDSLKEWKSVSTKIIKDNNGLCMICSHNPSGFKWIFSSLSKEFSKSFSETRHVPIDINPDSGVPSTFVEFLEKIIVEKESTSTSILSQISDAFDSFAVQIHDELTVNVFEALKTLSEGIIGNKSNNLSLTDETLEEIREPIFILLYRIIFILYAEDRGIFPVDNKIYQEEFSLKWIKQNWLLESVNTKKLTEFEVEKRIKKLFRLIEIGSEELDYDKEKFFMRSYYGRIFDRKINHKLETWNISNFNLLEAINLLTRTKDKKGNYFFLDYSALETRHLGSIYERLLDFHLNVKNNKIAELPDPEERKQTGSYYTPPQIVAFCVEKIIGKLIDDINSENIDNDSKIEKILSLKILDPAMGSGHFLVGAVDYIAKRLCVIESEDFSEIELVERKRDVVRRCIYGVDKNKLAVDLARLSLWLETISSNKPLSFLSAHLKHGNSLAGAKFEDILDPQQTLVESISQTHLKKVVKDFIGFETLEDDTSSAVKAKLEKYKKMHGTTSFYSKFRGLLDYVVSGKWGVEIPPIGDMRQKIGEESLDFYSSNSGSTVYALRNEQDFFHWELEFPEIFYSTDGELKNNPGFDAIIGNPPYVTIENLSKNNRKFVKYLEMEFSDVAKGHWDLYIMFIRKSMLLLKEKGNFSFIVPSTFSKEKFGSKLRKLLVNTFSMDFFVDFGTEKVFAGVSRQYNIFVLSKLSNLDNVIKLLSFRQNGLEENGIFKQKELLAFDNCMFRTDVSEDDFNIKKKIYDDSELLGNICCINPGIVANSRKDSPRKFKKDDVITEKFSKGYKKYIEGKNIARYNIKWKNQYIDYNNNFEYFHRPKFPELFETNKIIIRAISGKNNRLIAIFDDKHFFTNHTCYHLILWTDEIKKLQNPGKWNSTPSKNNSLLYLMGICSSKLISYYFSKFVATGTLQGSYSAVHAEEIRQFPIKITAKANQTKIENLVRKLLSENILSNTKNDVEQNISENSTEKKIDSLVYEIYGISLEEQKIIEREFDN